MAWTKLKTSMVTAAVVLLAAGTSLIIIKEMRSDAHSPSPRRTAVTESIRGQLFHPEQLVDAGNTTPEAAWETRYWARSKGDYDAVILATVPQEVDAAKSWMGDKSTFHSGSPQEFATLTGFQILARKDLARDRVELKYQFGFGNDSATKIVVMVKAHGVWRCAQTRPHDASWDADSQPEPQS